jgi:hypothetical protein
MRDSASPAPLVFPNSADTSRGTNQSGGAFPRSVRSAIVEKTCEKFGRMETQGVAAVDIVEGMIGSDARVLGAGSLPFLADFSQDRELLFRING